MKKLWKWLGFFVLLILLFWLISPFLTIGAGKFIVYDIYAQWSSVRDKETIRIANEVKRKLHITNSIIMVVDKYHDYNAATFTDWWGRSVLILGEKLLQKLSPEEMRAVLGHEFGHILHGHTGYWVLVTADLGWRNSVADEMKADAVAIRVAGEKNLFSALNKAAMTEGQRMRIKERMRRAKKSSY